MRTAIRLAVMATTLGWAGAANAQMLPNGMVKALDADAMKAVAPAVQAVLADGTPGALRPWKSATADGNVRLIGPDVKQPACRRVRLNSVVAGVEKRGYVFVYCPDAAGQWRAAG